jgi:hypothetical protein
MIDLSKLRETVAELQRLTDSAINARDLQTTINELERLSVATQAAVPVLSAALPALSTAAEAVTAWVAADSAGRTAARSDDPAELAAAWRAVEAAEALLHAAAKGMREVEG